MEIENKNKRNQFVIKLTDAEKEIFQAKAEKYHFRNVSEYVRYMCLNGVPKVEVKSDENNL